MTSSPEPAVAKEVAPLDYPTLLAPSPFVLTVKSTPTRSTGWSDILNVNVNTP